MPPSFFPHPNCLGPLMDLNVTKTGFRRLSEFMTRRGIDYTAATGRIFPRPIPTRQAFFDTWNDMAKSLELRPLATVDDPHANGRSWPVHSRARSIQSRPPLGDTIDWGRPLTFIVCGDAYPCVGGSWTQLSIGLLAVPVLGGDQPFIRRLIGVFTSPQVGSIYNMGVWDKAAATWWRVHVRRTLDNEAAARHQYQVAGGSLNNGGCITEPCIVVDWCWVFLCILHCCMAIGRLPAAFVEARPEALPKENAKAVQRLSYRARKGVKLGACAAPDGEKARALFLAWKEMGPLLAYAPEEPEWQAVVGIRDLLRDLYNRTPPLTDLARLLSRGTTARTAARPSASLTTSSTLSRMSRRRWLMRHALECGGGRCLCRW